MAEPCRIESRGTELVPVRLRGWQAGYVCVSGGAVPALSVRAPIEDYLSLSEPL